MHAQQGSVIVNSTDLVSAASRIYCYIKQRHQWHDQHTRKPWFDSECKELYKQLTSLPRTGPEQAKLAQHTRGWSRGRVACVNRHLNLSFLNGQRQTGDEDDPGNYSGITVTAVLAKLFAMVLEKRISYWAQPEAKVPGLDESIWPSRLPQEFQTC